MTRTRFEWDERKNISNQQKHGISFEQAAQVFFDPLLIVVEDRIVEGEARWQALGAVRQLGSNLLLLVVVHTIREENDELEIIRIISARQATRRERIIYENEER